MPAPVVEPVGPHRENLGELLDEIEKLSSDYSGPGRSVAPRSRLEPMIAGGTGFALLNGADVIGLLLYSAEYDLRFSSFLKPSSARELPKSVTISACHVLDRAREKDGSDVQLLLQSAVARLRTIKSIETIAFKAPPLRSSNLDKTLEGMGFLSCRRVQMEFDLKGDIPGQSAPPDCMITVPKLQEADDLRSIVSHGYFSEIDGYLFPDIAAVCASRALFDEFLHSSSIDRNDSVIARMNGYPCGCVLVLSDEDRKAGLIGVVAVIPTMRGRGIARGMLLRVLHWLKEHEHACAALAVTIENKPAFSLYSTLGFREVAPRTSISVWRRSVSKPRVKFRRKSHR